MRALPRTVGLLAILLLASIPATGATVTIVVRDGPGEGFNDPTPVSPVTGNPGTTLGQQRLNAFQAAANVWGGKLASNVTILLEAEMSPLSCSPDGAILGMAGPTWLEQDFPGSPRPRTW